jgi:WD40 repeat protein
MFPHHIALEGNTLLVDLNTKPDLTPTGQAALVDLTDLATRRLQGKQELRYTAISPDGRWAATGNKFAENVTIWSVGTGASVYELPTASTTVVAFSPNGDWLATVSTTELAMWSVETWKKVHALPQSTVVGAVAWSPDSRVLAMTTSGSRIVLVDAASCQCLATLSTNDEPAYVSWLAFNPDGDQLAVCCAGDGLRVWDLRQLRLGLRRIGLDWKPSTGS